MEPFIKVLPEVRDVLVIMRDASDTLYALRRYEPNDNSRRDWEMCTLVEIQQAIETVDQLQDVIGYATPTHRMPNRITTHRCMHDARYYWWFVYTMLKECRADGKYLSPTSTAMEVALDTVKVMMANARLCLEFCKRRIEDGRQDSV